MIALTQVQEGTKEENAREIKGGEYKRDQRRRRGRKARQGKSGGWRSWSRRETIALSD